MRQFLFAKAKKVPVWGGVDAGDSVGHEIDLRSSPAHCFRSLAVKPKAPGCIAAHPLLGAAHPMGASRG
jgi:hypothetical protein